VRCGGAVWELNHHNDCQNDPTDCPSPARSIVRRGHRRVVLWDPGQSDPAQVVTNPIKAYERTARNDDSE
jgi:hypothetical protein